MCFSKPQVARASLFQWSPACYDDRNNPDQDMYHSEERLRLLCWFPCIKSTEYKTGHGCHQRDQFHVTGDTAFSKCL